MERLLKASRLQCNERKSTVLIETCYFSSQEKKDRDKSRDKDKDRDRERERDRDREKDRRRDKGDRKESAAEEPNDVKMEEPSAGVDKGELF